MHSSGKGYEVMGLSSLHLKIIAVCLMTVDHFTVIFLDELSAIGMFLRFLGRIAMPIFCFLIAEGYRYTKNINSYLLRLFIFALLSHLPFVLCFDYGMWERTSVYFTLFLGLLALHITKSQNVHVIIKILTVVACCLLATVADWDYVGVLWVLSFGLFNDMAKRIAAFSAVGIFLYIIPTAVKLSAFLDFFYYPMVGLLLAIIPLLCYRPQKVNRPSKAVKWLFYIFYPAHLLVLFLLDALINGVNG